MDTLQKLSAASETTRRLLKQLNPSIFTSQPSTLGLPGSNAQSTYYKTSVPITREEVTEITDVLVKSGIDPENTRIVRTTTGHHVTVNVLQGSVEQDPTPKIISDSPDRTIRLVRGDHSEELQRICKFLEKASDHTEDTTKRLYISQICRSFQTGDLQAYKDSQRTWVRDRLTNVETVFGFVEPYRDPCGIRAEFEAIVGIENPYETAMLHRLGEDADSFIGRLPWVKTSNGGDDMYDFEAPKVDVPSLISIESTSSPRRIGFDILTTRSHSILQHSCVPWRQSTQCTYAYNRSSTCKLILRLVQRYTTRIRLQEHHDLEPSRWYSDGWRFCSVDYT